VHVVSQAFSLLTVPIGKLVLQFIGKNHAVSHSTTLSAYLFIYKKDCVSKVYIGQTLNTRNAWIEGGITLILILTNWNRTKV